MAYPLRAGVTRLAFIDGATAAVQRHGALSADDALAMLRRVHGSDFGITKLDAINTFHDALYLARQGSGPAEIKKLLGDVRRQCALQFNFDGEHRALKNFIEQDLMPMPEVNLRLCENLSGLSVHYPSEERQ